MKKLLSFALFCCSLATISSCSKKLSEPEIQKNDSGSKQGSSTLDQTSLLTAHVWVYYEYFFDFNAAATSLVWKTNRSSNTLNLSLNQVKFNEDGTYWEIDETGTFYPGTWTYIDGGAGVQVVSSRGTFSSTIQKLTGNRYEWVAPNGSYGIMIPQDYVPDTSGGQLHLLTSHNWVYDEYFNNFSATPPSLVWKTNKASSTFNLSQNVVKFNTDGTFWEIDENGILYSGTWSFLNNDTEVQVSSNRGTFTSTIQVLSTERYEWLDVGGSNYGELVPQ